MKRYTIIVLGSVLCLSFVADAQDSALQLTSYFDALRSGDQRVIASTRANELTLITATANHDVAPFLPQIAKALNDKSDLVRSVAFSLVNLIATVSYGNNRHEIVALAPLVRAGLKDSTDSIRAMAVDILSQTYFDTNPMLVKGIAIDHYSDSSSKVRLVILASVLRIIRSDPDGLVPIMRRLAIDDIDPQVRLATVRALGNLSVLKSRSPQILIDALADKDDAIRAAAANSLGELGSLAVAAIPTLTERSREDQSDSVKSAARDALDRISKNRSR